MTPVRYLQTDKQWSSISYSAPGESTTIGKAGCGPTCAAMVIASLKDPMVTPLDTAKWSLKHGYKVCKQGTAYAYFVPQLKAYGIECVRLNTVNICKGTSQIADATRKKIGDCLYMRHWIIACMGKGDWTLNGHYVLAYKTDGEAVWIHDPASSKTSRTHSPLAHWLPQIKYAWEIIPQEKQEDDEVVEDKKMAVLGQEISLPTIFKDGKNYVAVRELCEAMGLAVTSDGSTPIVSTGAVKIRANGEVRAVSGMNAGGTVYAAVRPVAEMLDKAVSWDNANKVVILE